MKLVYTESRKAIVDVEKVFAFQIADLSGAAVDGPFVLLAFADGISVPLASGSEDRCRKTMENLVNDMFGGVHKELEPPTGLELPKVIPGPLGPPK